MLVISDIDGVLREDKLPLPKEVEEALRRFVFGGGELVCITGAPLSHVPEPLFELAKIIFAEMGAVRWEGGKVTLIGATEVEELRFLLKIKIEDGVQEIDGTIIIEGPRQASLTFLFGSPPHYPGIVADANFEYIRRKVEKLIRENDLALHVISGRGTGYSWLDITPMTKEKTIRTFLQAKNPYSRAFYLGDGENDIPVMKLPEVIPVGFPNCHPEIQKIAKLRGVFAKTPLPGGVVEFFELLGEE